MCFVLAYAVGRKALGHCYKPTLNSNRNNNNWVIQLTHSLFIRHDNGGRQKERKSCSNELPAAARKFSLVFFALKPGELMKESPITS